MSGQPWATDPALHGARADVVVSASGWMVEILPGGKPVRGFPVRQYAAVRDAHGVLRDTGGSMLDEGGEVGMALSLLAEALDDVSDALYRRNNQGGE
jgi:hypothetical protein